MNGVWKVLVCDSIDKIGVEILTKAGMIVDYQPDIALEKLMSLVSDYDVWL